MTPQTEDLTIEQIMNWPRDEDMVLEDRRMYQALDALKATKEFARSCIAEQIEAMKVCQRIRLVSGLTPYVEYTGKIPIVLGYALGRTWIAEL